MPRPGHVVEVGAACSVQFASNRGFHFRIRHVEAKPTYVGWVWLDGYQLSAAGDAIERRSIFVQINGLRPVPDGWPRHRNERPTDGRPRNNAPKEARR